MTGSWFFSISTGQDSCWNIILFVCFMCLNFLALWPIKNPLELSVKRKATFLCLQYLEQCPLFQILLWGWNRDFKINRMLTMLQQSAEQAFGADSPLPLTFLAVVLNRQIASWSWARVSKESSICCHLAGLKTVTLSWKEVLHEFVVFVFGCHNSSGERWLLKQEHQRGEQYFVTDL